MDFNALLYSLGLSGFFSSRAFLPAFLTALALKYGDSIPLLGSLDFIKTSAENPSWFTHPVALWGLGLLALAELLADKSPELRQLMDEGSVYAKTALSAATTFGLLSVADKEAVENVISQAGIFDLIPAALSGAVTYLCAGVRQAAVSIVDDADEDDSLGIRGFISWCEELWALGGVWLLMAIPVVGLALIAFVYGILWLIRKRHEAKEEASKVACPACQARIHPFATACYACGAAIAAPRKIGALGGAREETESSIEAQKIRLLAQKRSPLSGDRVKGRGIALVCAADGQMLFGDRALNRRYIETIDSRLPKVLLVSGLLGIVPILGLVAGVIYYRFQLVGPYRRYLTWGRGFVVKWLLRLLFLFLALLQAVPVAGWVSVPLMAFLNHRFYRRAFCRSLREAGLEPI